MEPKEKYRLPEPSGNSSNYLNLRRFAKSKYQLLHRLPERVMGANSSVSLPNWNAARLNKAIQKFTDLGIRISRTDIITAVLKIYLIQLRKHDSRIDRIRRKNDELRTYVKISTYCRNDEWEQLQMRIYQSKITLSHALDIALRLYLKTVENRLLKPARKHDKSGWGSIKDSNIFLVALRKRTLDSLRLLGKYQKNLTKVTNTCSKIEITYWYSPCIRARAPKNLRFLL